MKEKILVRHTELTQDRVVTVAIIARDFYPKRHRPSRREKRRMPTYKIKVGVCIKNPIDYFKTKEGKTDTDKIEQIGKEIAIGRAYKNPIMEIEVESERVTNHFLNGILAVVIEDVSNNIFNYKRFSKNGRKEVEATFSKSKNIDDSNR